MPDYPWRDPTDPNEFAADFKRGFLHYRAEWERLMNLLVTSYDNPNVTTDERNAMRSDRNHAAARMVGFSHHLI